MTAEQLIKILSKLPPETVVVKFHAGAEGYDEIWFTDGTYKDDHWDGIGTRLRKNRAKFVKGQERPDFLTVDNNNPSRAKTQPFVVLY